MLIKSGFPSTDLFASVSSPEVVLPRREEIQVQPKIQEDIFEMTPLSRAQFLCFLLVWVAYASTYLLRKPLGVIKADLGEELGVRTNISVSIWML